MAVSFAVNAENGNKVWQKVKNYLSAERTAKTGTTVYTGAGPAAQSAFDGLKKYLAQQKRNPDLLFIPFSSEDCVANGGTMVLDQDLPYHIYGCYIKSRRLTTAATTAEFFALHDADDNSATTTTLITALLNADSQEYSFVSGDGLPGALDITVSVASAVGGATEPAATLGCDGFLIVGA